MGNETRMNPLARFLVFIVLVGIIVAGYQAYRWVSRQGRRAPQVFAWLRNPLDPGSGLSGLGYRT